MKCCICRDGIIAVLLRERLEMPDGREVVVPLVEILCPDCGGSTNYQQPTPEEAWHDLGGEG